MWRPDLDEFRLGDSPQNINARLPLWPDTSGSDWVLLGIASTYSFNQIPLWWNSVISAFCSSIRSYFISEFDCFTPKHMITMTESSRPIAEPSVIQWSKPNMAIDSSRKTIKRFTFHTNVKIKLIFSFRLFEKMRQRLLMALNLIFWQSIGDSAKKIFGPLHWRVEEKEGCEQITWSQRWRFEVPRDDAFDDHPFYWVQHRGWWVSVSDGKKGIRWKVHRAVLPCFVVERQ